MSDYRQGGRLFSFGQRRQRAHPTRYYLRDGTTRTVPDSFSVGPMSQREDTQGFMHATPNGVFQVAARDLTGDAVTLHVRGVLAVPYSGRNSDFPAGQTVVVSRVVLRRSVISRLMGIRDEVGAFGSGKIAWLRDMSDLTGYQWAEIIGVTLAGHRELGKR